MGLLLSGHIISKGANPDEISLSGTTGTPEYPGAATRTDPDDATFSWLFAGQNVTTNSITVGQSQYAQYDQFETASYTSVNTSTDWVIPNLFNGGPYYMRATNHSGDNPTSGTLGSWISIDRGTNLTWSWQRTTIGSLDGTLKIEIATDSSGVDIVATGYYRGKAEVLSGA